MKQMTVAELKTSFSDVLVQVQNGERVAILYGRAKKPVAKLVPFESPRKKRKIGTYEGIASYTEKGNGKISLEEFLGT